MSAQLNTQQITEILKAAQAQQLDLNNLASIEAFTSNLTSKPAKVPRSKTPVEDKDLCLARVWGTGSGNDRCHNKHVDGCFCKSHAQKFAICSTPCTKDEQGNWLGLHTGRIDQSIPFLCQEGLIAIRWNNPEIKAKIAEMEGNAVNSKASKFTDEWFNFNKTKKVPTVKRIRKVSEPQQEEQKEQKEPVVKAKKSKKSLSQKIPVKKSTNAFMFFSNEKRSQVKAQLLADFLELQPNADDKAQKAASAVGKVAQAIGALWAKLSDDDKAPYKALETADKARYTQELEAFKASASLQEITQELEPQEPQAQQEQPQTDADGATECEEIDIDGVTYLHDSNTGDIYNQDCEVIGKLVNGELILN